MVAQEQRSFIETARRAQIVESAIETIAALGYAQASLAQIAKRAGISKGVISYHFGSKDELIEQIVVEIYTAGATFMIPRLMAAPDPAAQLRTYLTTNVEFIGAHRQQMIALVEIFANHRAADGAARYTAAEDPSLAPLAEMLRLGQEAGAFRPFSTLVMARTIRQAIDVLPAQLAADPTLDTASYGEELANLFDFATRKRD